MDHVSRNMKIWELMAKAGRLKELKRTGWVESGVPSPESVADHSYRTALLSMILSDSRGLDTQKTVRMALIHDLAESTIGDLTPRQKQGNHDDLESNAMNTILSTLPKDLQDLYTETWDEYQRNESPEAILVHNADKLEMLFQASEYEKTGANLDQFWETEIAPEYEKYKPERG